MSNINVQEADYLLSGIGQVSDSDVLSQVHLNGVSYLCRLRLNEAEKYRRQQVGYEAVLDRGLLHAIWSVSTNGTRLTELSRLDIETLGSANPAVVHVIDGVATRLYEPIGEVVLVAAKRSTADLAIQRVLEIPPVFFRVAMWRGGASRWSHTMTHAVSKAELAGVGLIECDDASLNLVSEPRSPIRGIPTVYRWLIAELAFDDWGQAQRAQA